MKLKPEAISKDDRRKMVQVLTADIKQINFWNAKEGSVLGNHYHRDTSEYLYIIYGRGTLKLGDEMIKLAMDDIVEIPKGINHTLHCDTDLEFLTFLSQPFNKNYPDLWKLSA